MNEVRRLRLEKGWSQNELAYHAKLAPSVISLIETGKRDPNATTLRKLADALEVRVPDLFEESEVRPKAPRRSRSEPTFNGLLAEERLLTYLRPSLDEISNKAARARFILEKTSSFAEPLVEEPGVTPAATLTMWSTHITDLRTDAHWLARRWGEILEGISVETLPSEERVLLEALLSDLQGFESAVEELQTKFYSDFREHRDAVKLLPNLLEHQPSDAPAADKRKSAGA